LARPEGCNNDPATHPSARNEQMIADFKKTSDGPIILHNATLAAVRAACPHFGQWLATLEGLGGPNACLRATG